MKFMRLSPWKLWSASFRRFSSEFIRITDEDAAATATGNNHEITPVVLWSAVRVDRPTRLSVAHG
jgi:hypothetical protein